MYEACRVLLLRQLSARENQCHQQMIAQRQRFNFFSNRSQKYIKENWPLIIREQQEVEIVKACFVAMQSH